MHLHRLIYTRFWFRTRWEPWWVCKGCKKHVVFGRLHCVNSLMKLSKAIIVYLSLNLMSISFLIQIQLLSSNPHPPPHPFVVCRRLGEHVYGTPTTCQQTPLNSKSGWSSMVVTSYTEELMESIFNMIVGEEYFR